MQQLHKEGKTISLCLVIFWASSQEPKKKKLMERKMGKIFLSPKKICHSQNQNI